MPASVLDLELDDATDPYAPTHGHEEAPTFARPSSAYPLAHPDDDGNPTTLFDRDDPSFDEGPTVQGEPRSYPCDERTTTPARRSRRFAAVTPYELDASYEAAIRRFR